MTYQERKLSEALKEHLLPFETEMRECSTDVKLMRDELLGGKGLLYHPETGLIPQTILNSEFRVSIKKTANKFMWILVVGFVGVCGTLFTTSRISTQEIIKSAVSAAAKENAEKVAAAIKVNEEKIEAASIVKYDTEVVKDDLKKNAK